MIICFECTAEVQEALQLLVQKGRYRSRSEAISSAILNMSLIQAHAAGRDALVFTDEGRQTRRLAGASRKGVPGAATSPMPRAEPEMPPVFLLPGIADEKIRTMPSVAESEPKSGSQPSLKSWLFGQYNKFLPIKANTRALAHFTSTSSRGVSLNDASRAIAREAAKLGQYLERCDRQNGTGKDDALATAFPVNSKDPEKALIRYAQHFVGAFSSTRQPTGFLACLKFIQVSDTEPERVLLTEAALRFALMPNPILDSQSDEGHRADGSRKFSDDEQALLREHIMRSVPVERCAYTTIASAVSAGAVSPDKIDAWLISRARHLEIEITPGFVATQRSGAISRMADLGLIARHRSGLQVTYALSASGQALFEHADRDS